MRTWKELFHAIRMAVWAFNNAPELVQLKNYVTEDAKKKDKYGSVAVESIWPRYYLRRYLRDMPE